MQAKGSSLGKLVCGGERMRHDMNHAGLCAFLRDLSQGEPRDFSQQGELFGDGTKICSRKVSHVPLADPGKGVPCLGPPVLILFT